MPARARKAAATAKRSASARPQRRYIAFLRAINVGGHIVRMEQLRVQFEALGFANVATFIASGNVIFDTDSTDAAALEARIERQLQKALGYEVATFLRTPQQLIDIIAYNAFPAATRNAEQVSLYVGFLTKAPTADAQKKLVGYNNDVDELHVHGREVYWLGRRGFAQSTFSGALLEKTVGRATLRNITTVRKLAEKYPPAAGDPIATPL